VSSKKGSKKSGSSKSRKSNADQGNRYVSKSNKGCMRITRPLFASLSPYFDYLASWPFTWCQTPKILARVFFFSFARFGMIRGIFFLDQ
jgi:hypothetical protein